MKVAVQRVARALGFEVFRYGIRTPFFEFGLRRLERRWAFVGGHSHALLTPIATYAPWQDDKDFLEINQYIKGNTFVDKYRCYELWSLARQTVNVPGAILEVGVWRGGTGVILASANPQKRVYLADTFTGVVKAGAKDASYSGGEHSDTSEDLVRKLASAKGLNNIVILKGIFPDDFPDVGKESFSLVHIDVDVFDSAKDILDAVWANMPVGGTVVFDDYGFASCDGITTLVNRMVCDSDKRVLYNLNGHAVFVKVA